MVAACHIWLGGTTSAAAVFSLSFFGALAGQVAPVLLVAYIVTMFSSDIHFGLNRVRLLAETDELTGALNMRGFAIAASRLVSQAVRYERPATVLMIDSDNLKAVNDAHGHDAGNQLLRQLAQRDPGRAARLRRAGPLRWRRVHRAAAGDLAGGCGPCGRAHPRRRWRARRSTSAAARCSAP